MIDQRDQLLLDALAKIHDEHHAEPIKVAVVYGAAHVTTVVRELKQRFGYFVRVGDWLDLFSL